MSDDSPGSSLQAALGAVGKLRECVSAAVNLEHLLSSRDVGPKVLDQVVPDVASELRPLADCLSEVIRLSRMNLGLRDGDLEELRQDTIAQCHVLLAALESDSKTPMNAKRRLAVERALKNVLPTLTATLFQVELLLEAAGNRGVPMSVFELLSSTPDFGSNRPHRPVSVIGPTEDLNIAIPARIGLRCLGMLASACAAGQNLPVTLRVSSRGERVDLKLERSTSNASGAPSRTVKLPIYVHTPHSLKTVEATLVRYDGSLQIEELLLSLPAAG